MNSSERPWDAEDAFPLKPEGHDYGYKQFTSLQPCSQGDLVEWFKFGNLIRPKLVWTPESPRLVTPAESRLLWVDVRDICVRRTKAVIVVCLLLTGLFAMMAFTTHPRVRAFRPFGLANLILCGLVPLVWSYVRLKALRSALLGDTTYVGRHARFFAWMRSRKLSATWVILGCLAVAGLAQLTLGDSRAMGAAAFDRPMIQVGEFWRLVTGSFLHTNWGHFIGNFLWIALMAWFVENLTSRHHLAIVVLASCVAGGLGSLVFLSEDVCAGASDVCYGLDGFLLMQALRRRPFFPRGMWRLSIWLLAISVAVALWSPSDANHVAHAAGFLAGLTLGALLPPSGGRGLRFWGLGSSALIVATTLGVVALTAAGRPGINVLYNLAWDADDAGDHEEAVETYTKILGINPKYVAAYWGRAAARWSLNDLEGARSDYDAAIALEANDEDAWRTRGSLRAEMGDLDGGLEDVNRSFALNPRTEHAHEERAWIRFLRGEIDDAMKDVDSALSVDPNDPYAISIRGRIKARRGDLEGAIADQTLAIRRMRDGDALVARGDAKTANGDLAGALQDYDSALKFKDDDPEALLGRGLVRQRQKDDAGARFYIEAALKSAHRWWRRRAEAEAALKELR